MWEAVGAHERGRLPRAELDTIEREACPGAGYCAGNFTANTMAIVVDMLGLGIVGDGMIPAAHVEEKDAAAARAGALAVELAANGTTSKRFLDRRALENAMAGAVASGGSTNGFLHLLAIAREAGVPLDARRARRHQREHAGARRPRAGRALRRLRPVGGGRDRDADPRADPRAATSTAPRRPSTAARSPRRRPARPSPTAR